MSVRLSRRTGYASAFTVFAALLILVSPHALRAEDDPNNSDDSHNKKKSKDDDQPYQPGRAFGLKKFDNKDADLTPEQLREKTLKKMQEDQAKAQKQQEKWEKKQRDKKTKNPDDASDENKDMTIFSNTKTVEVDSAFDNHGHKVPQSIPKNGAADPNRSHTVEFDGTKSNKVKNGTVEFDRTDLEGKTSKNQKDIQRSNDGSTELMDPDKAKKQGFFEKIFGKKKETDSDFKSADKGDQVKLGANSKTDREVQRAPVGSHDTVVNRVEAEMARKRLQGEASGKAQPEKPPADASGEVVDLNADTGSAPGTGAADVVPIPPTADDRKPIMAAIEGTQPEPKKSAAATGAAKPDGENPDGTAPATEADIKYAQESQYKDGLKSKDLVAKEAAYQRAAVEHRTDAIPYLIQEIHDNTVLAPYAAQYLAGIGKLNDDVEVTLIHGLYNTDGNMRRSCAEALGYLKARHAVQPLLTAMKTEKSYSCRSAYAQTLGVIGDRTAIAPLKLMLEDRSEVEFVRSRVAQALANLGDPSGRAHLVTLLDSRLPAMQVMALSGLAQLHDPEITGYLNSALESPYDEVWVTAMTLLPSVGLVNALPMMRARLNSSNETLRRRAALVMGLLGSDDALPYIERACRVGSLQERVVGCELMAKLMRTDKIPLLIEKLQDSHTLVRQAAAVSLVHLKATEAIPALVEAGRGQKSSAELPPGLRGGQADATERLTMLSCVRTLRGEQGDIFLSTLPNAQDQSWPEVDRVLSDQTVELLKLYQLVDVVPDNNRPVGAVLKTPDGKELLVREGETVTGGFRVRDMSLPSVGKDKQRLPGYVTLMRGEQSVRLIIGHSPELEAKSAK